MEPEEKSNTWRDVVSVLTLFWVPPIGVIVMWLISRWSVLAKWIITILVGVIPLVILGSTSYNGYKFVNFQKSYSPVLGVQQALDIYGLQNGKYPQTLNVLVPKFLKEVPADKDLKYTPANDLKSYTLNAKIEGKDVELKPSFTPVPSATATTTQ